MNGFSCGLVSLVALYLLYFSTKRLPEHGTCGAAMQNAARSQSGKRDCCSLTYSMNPLVEMHSAVRRSPPPPPTSSFSLFRLMQVSLKVPREKRTARGVRKRSSWPVKWCKIIRTWTWDGFLISQSLPLNFNRTVWIPQLEISI